jgi:hypothetical protein
MRSSSPKRCPWSFGQAAVVGWLAVGGGHRSREPALALVKAFDPLKKFKIVLILHAHKAVDRCDLVNFFLLQDGLQQLEVLEDVVAELGV